MNGYYEHHLSLQNHKLCPFIVRYSKNPVSSPANWHKNLEILLFTEGEGKIQYGKETLAVSASDIVIINSGVLHRIYNAQIGYQVIIIDEKFCNENGINTSTLSFDKIVRDKEAEELIISISAKMREYLATGESLLAARVRMSVLSLLIILCQRYSVCDDGRSLSISKSEQYVKRIIEYINDNYSREVTLEELADLCGVTKFHLAREFKKITGQTVLTYTNILRCRKATVLISEGKTVTEAAFDCGFESLSYFSKTYKKIMGAPPSKNGK